MRANTPCQDASLIRVAGTGPDGRTLVLACSDGAGSATLSDRGSWMAVHSLVASATNYVAEGRRVADLREEDLAGWYRDAAWQLQMEADAERRPLRDYACTLLCAVIDGKAAAYAQLGDGAIVAGCGDDIVPVFWPQQGEYANTTFFITAPEHLERVQVRTGAEVPERVALMSDGLQNLALHLVERRAHPGFFSPLFRDLLRQPEGEAEALREPLRDFLDSPRINARTDDDKSLLLAVREVPAPTQDAAEAAPAAEDEAAA
ncbi:MAG: PP2C family serine/threonine-protein phosphatase [Longimicrobiaceae bacterium]